MPLPPRLQRKIDARELSEFTALCESIVDGLESGDDVNERIAGWNRRARRQYATAEFRTYAGADTTENFVRTMLLGEGRWIDDLSYAEAMMALEAITAVELSEPDNDHALAVLETNLPGSNLIDLIYNPDVWFALPTPPPLELEQILAYAMERSDRTLAGAPKHVPMPVPLPGTDEHRALLRAHAWRLARRWATARAERTFTVARQRRIDLEFALTQAPVAELRDLLDHHGDALTAAMHALDLWPKPESGS